MSAISLSGLAKALGGEISGRDRVLCPGPGHRPLDRSLSVWLTDTGGFTVHSFAGDDLEYCRQHVAALTGLAVGGRQDDMTPEERAALARKRAEDERKRIGEAAWKRKRALDLWANARPPAGSPIEPYFARRGLQLPDDPERVIRWHPDCPFGPEHRREGCMVALVRAIAGDEPMAVHRTALTPAGEKLGRLALGSPDGGAVKLTADEDVTMVLGVGEGIESTLSLRNLEGCGTLPVWALLTSGLLAKFPVLPGIETLWIAVDRDRPGFTGGAGPHAARELAERWNPTAEIVMHTAAEYGRDLNDLSPRAEGLPS